MLLFFLRGVFLSHKKSYLKPDDKEVNDYLDSLHKINTIDQDVKTEEKLLGVEFKVKEVFEKVYLTGERVDLSYENFKIVAYPIKSQRLVRIDVFDRK